MRGLREWLDLVNQAGKLKQMDGVSWDKEMGIITAEMSTKQGPSVLFDNIPGYEQGYRVLTNMNVDRHRIAITCNLPACESDQQFMDMMADKPREWELKSESYPYKEVQSGPVLENVLAGDGIDLSKFPAPLWHEKDGGRYIGTGCAVILRDPDTGKVNLGTYRVMLVDDKRVTVYISPGKHGDIIMKKYKERGEKCPIAVSLGHDPLMLLVASLPVPGNVSELDYAGAILEQQIETVKGPATGLPIPATSELVLEGFIDIDDIVPEGPFGEWTGYYAGGRETAPIMDIRTIMHRNDPIITGCSPARRGDEYEIMQYFAYLRSGMIKRSLKAAGVPDVRGVWATPVGGTRLLVVVSIKQRYAGHARQAAFVASQCHEGAYAGRYVIVVDEDIDPSDMNEVIWAMLTRSDPSEDIDIIRKSWSTRLDPMATVYNDNGHHSYFNSRAIIDACIPYERLRSFPERISYAKDHVEEVLKKFNLK